MNKEEEKISKYRSEVIEKFINCETLIYAIISQYYLKQVQYNFVFEVLYDPYFSFGLVRNILEKILRNIKKYNDNKMQELRNMNKIRNYFAHCNTWVSRAKKGSNELESFIPHPKKVREAINFEELYKEFIKKEPEVTEYLGNVLEHIALKQNPHIKERFFKKTI